MNESNLQNLLKWISSKQWSNPLNQYSIHLYFGWFQNGLENLRLNAGNGAGKWPSAKCKFAEFCVILTLQKHIQPWQINMADQL